MKINLKSIISFSLSLGLSFPALADDAEQGFVSLFDGESLTQWEGDPKLWSVEDGAITGVTNSDEPLKDNTFLIWSDGEVDDFELRLQYKIESGNSGVQYRSFLEPSSNPWRLGGYQADIDSSPKYTGINYGEKFRGILALRGQKTEIGANHKPTEIERFATAEDLQAKIKSGEWNDYRIVAKGFTFEHYINGELMSVVVDNDKEQRRRGGKLGFQLHQGPPMKVQFKDIRLKRLPLEDVKKVVFLAGRPSHGYGSHEHRAGCMLLADALNRNAGDLVFSNVYTNGWPRDPSAFDNADAIVIYCDGGNGHMANPYLRQLDQILSRGVGLGCLHYGVEVPKGEVGDKFVEWIGGYFETDWSVNPHWDATFAQFPDHPVANGVKPFTIRDEWYYHMRFRENMEGVTPILSSLPPSDTLKRKDGPHSNNPDVRAAVLERKEPQHVMWVAERESGGRGFGFTGGHFHNNWAEDSFRKVVLNAITWIAKADVPADGIPSQTPDETALEANQDFPKPQK